MADVVDSVETSDDECKFNDDLAQAEHRYALEPLFSEYPIVESKVLMYNRTNDENSIGIEAINQNLINVLSKWLYLNTTTPIKLCGLELNHVKRIVGDMYQVVEEDGFCFVHN